MLLTLLLLTSLYSRSLSASPLTSSPSRTWINSKHAGFLTPRGAPEGDSDGDNSRTTYDIVSSCYGTILACLWSAAHPNIDGPDDAGWTCFKRRLLSMIYAFIAPELMTLWAMRQYVAARFIQQDYNEHIAKGGPPRTSIKGVVREYFGRVPESTIERKELEPWTETHAFFVQMGGFMLYDRQGRPRRVLTYDDLRQLIATNKIDPPTLNAAELADRNKSDWLSKGVAVLQTTWFVVQCITRRVEGLPLSSLEVMTLAFAVLNAIVYWVWWNKPQGLGMGVCIMLKEDDDEDLPPRTSTTTTRDPAPPPPFVAQAADEIEMARLIEPRPPTEQPHSAVDADAGIISGPGATKIPLRCGFLRRKLAKDRAEYHWLIFASVRVPFRLGQTLLRPMSKILGATPPATFPDSTMRVPMFYSDTRGEGLAPWTTSCIIGVVFGCLHLLAWRSPFPSWLEHTYWRIFSAISVAIPALILVGTLLQPYAEDDDAAGPTSRMHALRTQVAAGVSMVFGMVINLSTFSYMFGRFALLALALLALRDSDPLLFVDVKWPSFIPHLF